VLRRHVTERVAPLPGIPDELWQLLLQCLAKAPASRLRAPELAARLRELLPGLAGMPPLDIDEPDDEEGPDGAAEDEPAPKDADAGPAATGEVTPPRGSVALVQGAVPDSNRETHTSMRVPGPDELAGGAHGTARAPRAAGERRAGSARHRSSPEAVRRRRLRLGAAAGALVVAVGLGTWLASGDSDPGDAGPGIEQPDPAAP
jgi:serine/threonine-protein kinase